jgi:hypothetical protein
MARYFFFVLTVILCVSLLAAIVHHGSFNKYTPRYRKSFSSILAPVNDDSFLGYGEQNLSAPRSLCKAVFAYKTAPNVQLRGFVPTPWNLEEKLSDSVTASLKLYDSGNISYSLNGREMWSSAMPRSYISSPDSEILRDFISTKPPEQWTFCDETSSGLRLHIAPFAITAFVEGKRSIVWTCISGYDITGICKTTECSFPAALGAKDNGQASLVSKNRQHRLALMPNADLVVIQTKADAPGSHIQSSKLVSSLMTSWCIRHV